MKDDRLLKSAMNRIFKDKRASKNSKQLEKHLKGIANHRRIDILMLLHREGPMTLETIGTHLDCHITTVSEHSARLSHAGLIQKNYKGRYVFHALSPYGKVFVKFIESFRQH